jgi:predicted nucleotidyltransferase
MQESKFAACLTALVQSGSEFILVGGLAAVLQGAPVQTYDVDIVYSRATENIQRLLEVLDSLDAIFRIQPGRRIKPNTTHLQGSGHLNLITRFGPLDLLASIGDGLTYEDLLPHSQEMSIADTVRIKVLKLDEIIAIKERLGSEKDAAVLPTLRQTALELKKRQTS